MEVVLSERVKEIIEQQQPGGDVLVKTLELVRSILEPKEDRYDMLYRYEHSLRVAAIGQRIAREESLPEVPLMMACLLHDVGYPECRSLEELRSHPKIGAYITRQYLNRIGFEEPLGTSICKAVLIHDRVDDLPPEATAFELSVRDADDIERSDAMRMCIWGYHDIGERSAAEVMEICEKRLKLAESSHSRICGTETARKMWLEELEMHRNFYERLYGQLQTTGEAERFIRGETL